MKGYDIIVLMGQSNAFGMGKGKVDIPFKKDNKIEMMFDPQICEFRKDANGDDYLSIDRNWRFVHSLADEKLINNERLGNFSLFFANEYINAGFLKKGRKLLIVCTAEGGTGFTKKHWSKGDVLNDRMIDMINNALKLDGENKIISFLWHQGEHDAFEQSKMKRTPDYIYKFYYNKLSSFITQLRNIYGNIPFIAGEFCHEWWDKNKSQCDAVISATKDVLSLLGNGIIVSSCGLLSNNKMINNGDDIHFCRQSLKTLGQRYFSAYEKLM